MDENVKEIFEKAGFKNIKKLDSPPIFIFEKLEMMTNKLVEGYRGEIDSTLWNKDVLLNFLRGTEDYYLILVAKIEGVIYKFPKFEFFKRKEKVLPEVIHGYSSFCPYAKGRPMRIKVYSNFEIKPEYKISNLKLTGEEIIIESQIFPKVSSHWIKEVYYKAYYKEKVSYPCEIPKFHIVYLPLIEEKYFVEKKYIIFCLEDITPSFWIEFVEDKEPYFKFKSESHRYEEEKIKFSLKHDTCFSLLEEIAEKNSHLLLELMFTYLMKFPMIIESQKEVICKMAKGLRCLMALDRML